MDPSFLIVMLAMFGLMWVLMIRPQRRRQQEHEQMLGALEVGDEILTVGGIYGHVQRIDGDDVVVEIAPGTEVKVARRGIATVFEADGEATFAPDAAYAPEGTSAPDAREAPAEADRR